MSLFNPRSSASVFISGLIFLYVLMPIVIFIINGSNRFELLNLSFMSLLGCFFIYLGSKLAVFDLIIKGNLRIFSIPDKFFTMIIWGGFIIFISTVWLTADRIPILAAMAGSDPETLAMYREQFLKARGGWQSYLVYINAIFCSALIPYSMSILFLSRSKFKWINFFLFFIYTISFLEKAFFLRAILPLIVLVSLKQINFKFKIRYLLLIIVLTFMVVGFLSGSGNLQIESNEPFFSANYIPVGVIDHLIWRSITIPVFAAADSLSAFSKNFNDQIFFGATSNLLTGIFGMERVEFERIVFEYQWGQNLTSTGNANAVYIIESFVNFGWLGVILFSLIIGYIFRIYARSNNQAFRSTWPLFAFGIFVSGLLGNLFSNGLIILILINTFIKQKKYE